MKTKLKSGNALVRLLLGHGEKLGMAGIVVCAGLLMWSAFGRERLADDHTPANLTSLTGRAEGKVNDASLDKVPEDMRLKANTDFVGEMTEVSSRHFPPLPYTIDRPVLDPVGLRTDPVLFTAEELEVNGDSGLWASSNPDIIKQKQIAWKIEQERLANEEEERRNRAERDAGQGRRGGRGGGEQLFGEGGGYGGARGARGQRETKRGGTIVQRTRTGAQLQGYEEIRARSWVTVLAKVPIEQQHQQYKDSLETARGYNMARDVPNYFGYVVERAEVTDAGQSKWKQIDLVTQPKLEKRLATYPIELADPIDPRVNHPVLTHPLPPLILREWGRLVTHSSMPLASEIDPDQPEETEETDVAEPTEEGGDAFAESLSRQRDDRRAGSEGYGGRSMRRGGEYGGRGMGGEGYGGEMYGGEGYGREAYGGEGYGGEMYGGGGYGGEMYGGRGSLGRGSGATLGTFIWDNETSHLLFRYFDHDVKAGHRYRYRVRLALTDVNHGVRPKNLDKSVTERRSKLGQGSRLKYRLTEWSEPSPVASVPLPARVYLVGAKPAKESNYTSEPEAELLIKALKSEYAAEVAYADDFGRGSVVNLREKATVLWSNKYEAQKDPEFEFHTGITVVDFSGGERLPNKKLNAPARVLLMDAAGRLFLQEELEDEETVAEYQAILEGDADSRRGYGGGRGGFEGRIGGEGYGGEGYGGER